ncbi:HIRAN domain-containing protein [Staphylococcus saprophyticus]|uniref:HIRAN domain-containing protein n=1 Tax=Staphylococcus saprophyticus TaxID=29385 RepID=UPI00115C616C|nr:HIRAN domain-containing protein [Staphylococcus saprophyticus]MDW3922281.1 HIRAN domain-containing protein [Staphylococcus saprophyticus]MDW4018914.1 HIRAN domain-containing protein [Staphylococcus saprophyticus]MDW4026473.1 HIRAN domain-containing protein [Staphylococcus saprophyticus]MDW4150233.1 HIRAN domain-containing protein [Staphylococcus saprophyticus]MDW4264034.1 HIRAN domain-containing protein [Staphylococcus saprophyticus]
MGKYREFIFDDMIAGYRHYMNDITKLAKEKHKRLLDEEYPMTELDYENEIENGIYLEDVTLVPNPNNKFDKNAIEVRSKDILVGYVPKSMNKKIWKRMKEAPSTIEFELVYISEDKNDEFIINEDYPERVTLAIYYDYD